MQVVSNRFTLDPVGTSGVSLCGLLLLYSGCDVATQIDAWCRRHPLDVLNRLWLGPGRRCILYTPTRRGKSFVEITYTIRSPLAMPAQAAHVVELFAKRIVGV